MNLKFYRKLIIRKGSSVSRLSFYKSVSFFQPLSTHFKLDYLKGQKLHCEINYYWMKRQPKRVNYIYIWIRHCHIYRKANERRDSIHTWHCTRSPGIACRMGSLKALIQPGMSSSCNRPITYVLRCKTDSIRAHAFYLITTKTMDLMNLDYTS